MTATLGDVFADTVFWLALIVRQDACNVYRNHNRIRQASVGL